MEHIFVEILNRSIAAGWVILAVAALRLLLRRAPKWTSCLLWALVAVRLVCPFSMESAFSLIPSRETVHGGMDVPEGKFVDSGIRFLDDAVNPALRRSFDSAAVSGAGLDGAAGTDTGAGPDAGAGSGTGVGPGTGADTGAHTGVNPAARVLFVGGIMWAAGIGILVLHSLVSYIRLWRRVRTAVRLEESVYESEFTDTPFVLGIVRPRIYLPAHMPEEMRVPVLAHERAHLRRLDNLWKMAGYALLCAYWFHPLVWAAYSLFCRDLELACDESVIKGYDAHRRRLYSEALLACSLDRRGAFGYPLAFGEVGVRERIKAVIRYKKPGFWMAVAAVAACIAVAICFLTDPMDSGDAQPLPSGAGGEAEADGNAGGDSWYAAGNGSGTKQGTVLDGQGGDGGERFGGTGTEADGPDGGSGAVGDDGGKHGGSDGESGDDGGSGESDGEHGDDGGAGESDGEPGSGGQTAGDSAETEAADSALREALVREWTEAFVSRDGNAVQRLATEGVAEEFELDDMLSGPQGQRSFGFSSPWPENVDRDAVVCEVSPEHAVILYYAWTSEPHVTIWKEQIFYGKQDGGYVVTREELTWLDDISSIEEYGEAYGRFGIDGTAMDYETNGLGEALNSQALLSSSTAYQDLFQPESAARRLLNLSEDSSQITLQRLFEEPGSINFNIGFPQEEENLPMPITMYQPYGEDGIWIPKNRRVDVVARFKRIDWEEIRSRHMALVTEPGLWDHVVLIAELPEDGIRLYGYNDAEWCWEGVAVEIGDDVDYFDWTYTSPRTILPEMYWNGEKRQLQVALNIYTGTGVAAQELHILQYGDEGSPQDYALELDVMQDMLYERIGFYVVEETGQMRLFDKWDRTDLGEVDIGRKKVNDIELGMISSYSLGESVKLVVEPGYWEEGMSIAQYPDDMPTLEVEVRLWEREGKIPFGGFGEIKSDAEPVGIDVIEVEVLEE